MGDILGLTLVAAALGAVVAYVFAQVSGEYCIGVRGTEVCRLDEVKVLLGGGLIGGVAGFLWGWRR